MLDFDLDVRDPKRLAHSVQVVLPAQHPTPFRSPLTRCNPDACCRSRAIGQRGEVIGVQIPVLASTQCTLSLRTRLREPLGHARSAPTGLLPRDFYYCLYSATTRLQRGAGGRHERRKVLLQVVRVLPAAQRPRCFLRIPALLIPAEALYPRGSGGVGLRYC